MPGCLRALCAATKTPLHFPLAACPIDTRWDGLMDSCCLCLFHNPAISIFKIDSTRQYEFSYSSVIQFEWLYLTVKHIFNINYVIYLTCLQMQNTKTVFRPFTRSTLWRVRKQTATNTTSHNGCIPFRCATCRILVLYVWLHWRCLKGHLIELDHH